MAPMRLAGALGTLVLVTLPSRPLAAQDTVVVPVAVPVVPAAPVVRTALQLDGSRLRAGTYRYDVVVVADSGPRTVGTHVVSIQEATHGGRRAWAIVDRRESAPPFIVRTATDTVLLDAASLRPLRWEAEAGGARFVAAFANDSIYGGGSAPGIGTASAGARQTFSIPAPAQAVTSEGALEAALQTVTMHAGWATEASMILIDLDTARTMPVQLTVEREEQAETAAGAFDAWVVSVRAGNARRLLWIDKATGVVVRTSDTPRHMPGMVVERVLLHAPGGEVAP